MDHLDQQHLVRSSEPLNTEPQPADLSLSFRTPLSTIFKRNHSRIPPSKAPYSLSISLDPSLQGQDAFGTLPPLELGLAEIKTHFLQDEVLAILQCAGNRRAEMNDVKKVEGLCWGRGAVANVSWRGALLRDVLSKWGVKEESLEGLHCHFECSAAPCEDDSFYGASIPLAVAMNPEIPIILAYEMNGEELTPEHGYPLRVVAPGRIGARWVKWLGRIVIRPFESACYYQQLDYKMLPSHVTAETKHDWMLRLPSMQEYDLNCAICSPGYDEVLFSASAQAITVRGYAFGGHGIPVKAVQVAFLPSGPEQTTLATVEEAADRNLWTTATLEDDSTPSLPTLSKCWTWTLWTASIPLSSLDLRPGPNSITLVARCEDAQGTVQPRSTEWNLRGLGEQGWSVVRIVVQS